MRLALVLIASLLSGFLYPQASDRMLSEQSEISVLTIGPGTNLNDAFGHNAIRVQDPYTNLDLVFNYGVYDFDTPNFYLKFAQGKLNYKIAANYYEDFFNAYIMQDRTIRSQSLNLNQAQRQAVFDYLLNNLRPENQFYLYDFFYDNCATKIRDVMGLALENGLQFPTPEGFEPQTFRTLIHQRVYWNSWGRLGIDIALGAVIDQEASPEEHMFLPDYIHIFFEEARLDTDQPLTTSGDIIYSRQYTPKTQGWFSSPLLFTLVIGVLIVWMTFVNYRNQSRTRWLDGLIFGLTGLVGVVVLLLWFATDHSATANNYNLLWAFALNLVCVPLVLRSRPKRWLRAYIKFLMLLLALMTLHWITGVQQFSWTLIPLLIALALRYSYLVRYLKT